MIDVNRLSCDELAPVEMDVTLQMPAFVWNYAIKLARDMGMKVDNLIASSVVNQVVANCRQHFVPVSMN